MNQIKLGRQIKKYRLLKKMTQDELSIATDVTRNFISDLERGVKSCKLETLILIANTLDVSIDVLLKSDLKINKNLMKHEICQDIMKLNENELLIISNLVEGLIAKQSINES